MDDRMADIVIRPVGVVNAALALHLVIQFGTRKRGKDVIEGGIDLGGIDKVNCTLKRAQVITIKAEDKAA